MHLRDIDCAFKIYPRRLFHQIELHSRGALIDAEVLAKAKLAGYKIAQTGVHHYPRLAGQQTGANLRVIARAFWELARLYGRIRFSRPGSRLEPHCNLRQNLQTSIQKGGVSCSAVHPAS